MELTDKPGNESEHKGGRLKRAFKTAKPILNLSPEQDEKIKQLFKDFREKKRVIIQEGGDNMNDNIHTIKKERKQRLMDVLNDDQKKILKEHLRELRNQVN